MNELNPTGPTPTQRCTLCAEMVKKEAVFCRYCGYSFRDKIFRFILPLLFVCGVFVFVGLLLMTELAKVAH